MRKRLLRKLQEVNGRIVRSRKLSRKQPTAPGAISPWPISTDIYFFKNTFLGPRMKTKATIDRFEEDEAVLILSEDEHEYIVPGTSLPEGVVQGLWLQVEDDRVINAVLDDEETVEVKERTAEKID